MKTSKLFTAITNTSWITTRLKPEFAHNPEHFRPCYYQKVHQGLNSLMFPLSCSNVHYFFVEISKIQFWYCFTGMECTTNTTWFLHYCIIFKTRSSHYVILWIFMEYIGALNVYVDTQPKLNIHKTYMLCVHWESCIYSGFFYKNIEIGESHAMNVLNFFDFEA